MTKGMYSYLGKAWKKPNMKELREKIREWKTHDAVFRIEKPTRLDRARSLGYKAKPGFIIARVRLKRGGRKRARIRTGRRSKRQTIRKTLMLNYQGIAEQRAASRYIGLEVLSSYWVGKDGDNYFYEIILIDPRNPQIKKDPILKWISSRKQRGRVFRGLTTAGKRSRGLNQKGKRREYPMNR